MKTKFIGIAALVTLIFTAVWLILLIWDQSTAGPLQNIDQLIAYLSSRDWRYTLTYLNAAMVTLSATVLMALLYLYIRDSEAEWALIGFVFVPVYSTLNLVVYLSQVTLVPALVNYIESAGNNPAIQLMLALSVQQVTDSVVAFFNGLAYALLGIPSIIYGLILMKGTRLMNRAGWLLAVNGLACIVGLTGYLVGIEFLAAGVIIGGALFFLALIPLSIAFLRPVPNLTLSPGVPPDRLEKEH